MRPSLRSRPASRSPAHATGEPDYVTDRDLGKRSMFRRAKIRSGLACVSSMAADSRRSRVRTPDIVLTHRAGILPRNSSILWSRHETLHRRDLRSVHPAVRRAGVGAVVSPRGVLEHAACRLERAAGLECVCRADLEQLRQCGRCRERCGSGVRPGSDVRRIRGQRRCGLDRGQRIRLGLPRHRRHRPQQLQRTLCGVLPHRPCAVAVRHRVG